MGLPLFSLIHLTALGAAGQASPASIIGGADATGHHYSWTVTNRHSSPIVFIEFPHYQANLFLAPKGWSAEESTFLVNVGVPDRPGVCVARASSPAEGIAPGRSAEFKMQIAAPGASRGTGEVRLRFADGSDATVPGVELPQPPPTRDTFVSLIGLGLIFGAWLMYQLIRNRRRKAKR